MKKIILASIVLLCCATTQAALILYGVQGNQLLTIDHNNPTNVNIIGNMNLGANESAFRIAYDSANNVLAALVRNTSTNIFTLHTVDRATGQATLAANIGDGDSVGFYEAFDYNSNLGKFVVSRGVTSNVFLSSDYLSLDLAGNLSLLSTSSGIDNDHGAYDPVLDRFMTSDSNSHSGLLSVNLSNGAVTQLGSGALGAGARDLAFNSDNGILYDVNNGNTLRTIDTNNGNGPLVLANVGTITGGVASITFGEAVPEPSTVVFSVLSLVFLSFFRRRLSA